MDATTEFPPWGQTFWCGDNIHFHAASLQEGDGVIKTIVVSIHLSHVLRLASPLRWNPTVYWAHLCICLERGRFGINPSAAQRSYVLLCGNSFFTPQLWGSCLTTDHADEQLWTYLWRVWHEVLAVGNMSQSKLECNIFGCCSSDTFSPHLSSLCGCCSFTNMLRESRKAQLSVWKHIFISRFIVLVQVQTSALLCKMWIFSAG